MTKLEFCTHINKIRLAHKNKWYTFTGIVDGKDVELKGFGTWIQIFNINDVNHSSVMDMSTREFKQYLIGEIK